MLSDRDFILGLEECEDLLKAKSYATSLKALHNLIFWSRGRAQIQIRASELMAQTCCGLGQYFFANEYIRYANEIRNTLKSGSYEDSVQLTDVVRLKAQERKLIEKTERDLIRCAATMWHQLGIPVLPEIEYMTLDSTYLVADDTTYLSCMSWWCSLPISIVHPQETERRLTGLITAFDLNLGSHVASRFEKTVATISLYNDSLPMVSAIQTSRLGVLLRIPADTIDIVMQAGTQIFTQILTQDFPVEQCSMYPDSNDPEKFVEAAKDASFNGATLFALAFYGEAANLYQQRRDTQGYLLSMLNQGMLYGSLGQQEIAFSILMKAWKLSKALDAKELNQIISTELSKLKTEPTTPANVNEISEFKAEPITPANDNPKNKSTKLSPFDIDPSSGKVPGFVFAEEADTESKVSELLCDAWKKEFPRIQPPFSLTMSHFI